MQNPADLKEICERIVAYVDNGNPAKDAIEPTSYTQEELLYELALAYLEHQK